MGAKPHILPFFVVIAHSKVRSAKRIVWRENQTELSDCVGGAGAEPPTSKKMTIFLMHFARAVECLKFGRVVYEAL